MPILSNPIAAWIAKLNKTFIVSGHYKMIIEGLGNTVKITMGALVIGVLIGLIIAVIKYLAEDSRGMKIPAFLCDFYVNVIRGIPVTVLLLIFYYLIMRSSTNGVLVATITFGIKPQRHTKKPEVRQLWSARFVQQEIARKTKGQKQKDKFV